MSPFMRKMRFATLSLLIGLVHSDLIEIETAQGRISGILKTARNGDAITAFYGIPYAEPPLGDLRWRRPRPAGTWTSTRDGTVQKEECLQNDVVNPSKVIGSEDCLYLNVFTKTPDPTANLPVLVWIHGGAFALGGASLYEPDYILEENVVLVVIQYRLNMFGFLSTEDGVVPGNYGMWDQLETLRWVRKNIKAYGGNPDQVTIFGESAGGASVHYLMLSPHTKGLFQNAISLSGTALCWWANVPNQNKNALKLAQNFHCPINNSVEMLECLKKVPAKNLADSQTHLFFDWHITSVEHEPLNVFSPRSDPEAKVSFLPKHPVVMIGNGDNHKIPYMLGYTDMEGAWRANALLPDVPNSPTWKEYLNKFDDISPLTFGLFGGQAKDSDEIITKVMNYYNLTLNSLQQDVLNDDTVHRFVDALSDSMFSYAIDTTAKLHAQKADTFYYLLTFPGEQTLTNFRSDSSFGRPIWEPLKRATHGSDLFLLFPFLRLGPLPPVDLGVSRNFIRLLVDFGRSGTPIQTIPDWAPLDVDAPIHAIVDEEFKVKEGLPFQERFAFWDGLKVYWNNAADQSAKVEL